MSLMSHYTSKANLEKKIANNIYKAILILII